MLTAVEDYCYELVKNEYIAGITLPDATLSPNLIEGSVQLILVLGDANDLCNVHLFYDRAGEFLICGLGDTSRILGHVNYESGEIHLEKDVYATLLAMGLNTRIKVTYSAMVLSGVKEQYYIGYRNSSILKCISPMVTEIQNQTSLVS